MFTYAGNKRETQARLKCNHTCHTLHTYFQDTCTTTVPCSWPSDLQPPPDVSWKRTQAKTKATRRKGEGREDYYALLGLQHERWLATEAQLKTGGERWLHTSDHGTKESGHVLN